MDPHSFKAERGRTQANVGRRETDPGLCRAEIELSQGIEWGEGTDPGLCDRKRGRTLTYVVERDGGPSLM